MYEQLAVSARASSLGNAVTAYSPGIMSIHYNPAGLTHLSDNEFSFGFMSPLSIKKESKFIAGPSYEGFMMSGKDPVADTSGETTGGAMYFPLLDDTKNMMVVPNLGFSHRNPGSKWTLAVGMYAPFAMGFNHEHSNDPARYGGSRAYNQRIIYAGPAVSCQVSKSFSVGFSIGIGQTACGLKQDLRAPNDIISIIEALGEATDGLEFPVWSEVTLPQPWFGGGMSTYETMAKMKFDIKDDFTTSYNLGFLWEPFRWFSFGACYQSKTKSDPSGDYLFSYSKEFQDYVNWAGSSPLTLSNAAVFNHPYLPLAEQKGTVVMKNYKHPQRAQFGIMLRPFERLRLMCDLNYCNWAAIKRDIYVFDQDIQLFQLATLMGYAGGMDRLIIDRDYKDIWHMGYGLEVQTFKWLVLRFGYEDRESAVRDRFFDLTNPIQDMKIYSCGMGIKFNPRWSIDLAASYMKSDELRIGYGEGNEINSIEFTDIMHNPYPGLDYEQETEIYLFSMNINYAW